MTPKNSWLAEKQSAHLYRLLAHKEQGTPRQKLFLQLAQEAEDQAAMWAEKLGNNDLQFYPDLRTRIVGFLIACLSPKSLRAVLAALKVRGLSIYTERLMTHPLPQRIEDVGMRHAKTKTGGNLRAAVFGVNDGLVSNAALIFGMVGATGDSNVILLAGVAGLLAGAFSMAAGEYVSVRSQREMMEYQLALEAEELRLYPEEETAELALIYEARGLSRNDAMDVARKLMADKDKALDTLAREELGVDPNELGSPGQAAAFSFISFSLGALVPLMPFLFTTPKAGLLPSIVLTGLTLFSVGLTISLFVGKNALVGGFRMLAIGASAGITTYFVGRWLGVTLS